MQNSVYILIKSHQAYKTRLAYLPLLTDASKPRCQQMDWTNFTKYGDTELMVIIR